MEIKKEIKYALNNLKRLELPIWWNYHDQCKRWSNFLNARKDEGKLWKEFNEERKLFTEFMMLRKKGKSEAREIEQKFTINDFEGKEDELPLPSDFIKQCAELSKSENKKMDELDIRECFELKQEDPRVSLREFAKKYGVSKDTIAKWLRMGEGVKIKLDEWEEKNKLFYDDKNWKEYEKLGRLVAKSKGVRKEDFRNWSYFYNFYFEMGDIKYD